MSEAGLWSTMRQGMARNWREATRHEDSLQKGIADVSFVGIDGRHGWIERLRTRLAEAERDAARYRWLRSAVPWTDKIYMMVGVRVLDPSAMDAAIDAAMAGDKP